MMSDSTPGDLVEQLMSDSTPGDLVEQPPSPCYQYATGRYTEIPTLALTQH